MGSRKTILNQIATTLSNYRKMKFLILLLSAVLAAVQGDFVVNEVNMNDKTFNDCQTCDARADRVGSRAAADALRVFMSRNYVEILVDAGEVSVTQNYPNEKIDTGRSCSYTAEARNIVGKAKMVPGSVKLSPEGVVYLDEIKNSFAVADVEHELTVDLDVRVWFGAKLFGECIRGGRKTCTTKGTSTGTNHISVVLAASNVLVECIGGHEHLTFNLDARAFNEAIEKTYNPVDVEKRGDCDLHIFGIKIGSINNKIQTYANRYLKTGDKFGELRGPKLVAELERKLGTKLGSLVSIKINDENGKPRTCSRSKRAARCVRKECPEGFSRIGDTEKCQKAFGMTEPNCLKYGSQATLFSKPIGSRKLYWCHVPMVPV